GSGGLGSVGLGGVWRGGVAVVGRGGGGLGGGAAVAPRSLIVASHYQLHTLSTPRDTFLVGPSLGTSHTLSGLHPSRRICEVPTAYVQSAQGRRHLHRI